MKHKTLTILTALALLLSAPLFAQTPDAQDPAQDPAMEQEQDSVEATVDTEEGEANLTATDAESDTQVQANIDTEDDVDVDAEANFDDDAEFDDETDDDSLPRTAGALPLLLLAGGAAGGSALSLRLLRRK